MDKHDIATVRSCGVHGCTWRGRCHHRFRYATNKCCCRFKKLKQPFANVVPFSTLEAISAYKPFQRAMMLPWAIASSDGDFYNSFHKLSVTVDRYRQPACSACYISFVVKARPLLKGVLVAPQVGGQFPPITKKQRQWFSCSRMEKSLMAFSRCAVDEYCAM